MPRNDINEQKFLNALNDIFIGAKIEGESGYINLMAIKSRYYQTGVFPQLMKDIEAALVDFPGFREELFDKLYSFFQRYFSESGSIYFRHTPLNQNIYEKVYTDDRDVVLFWKTHMLYYVKTDRLFKSLMVDVEGFKLWFDASQIELKQSNEKRSVVFAFREKRTDGTLVFDVSYSERGSKTKEEDILRALNKEGVNLSDEILDKAFRVFEKQSEVDFFINKDARSFLREQFDLWMYQYLFEGQNVWSTERIAQLQALKGIAYKVIDFISQFEDELVKIWNKPKFVRNSHYVITLDKLQGTEVLEKILSHPNFDEQVKEWRDLGMIEDDFQVKMLTQKDLAGDLIQPQYQHIPFDTKYFPDLELEILSLFDDLDASLDGWLIHSENYQALITIVKKFFERIQTIYIDPPFPLESSDQFQYRTNYKDSNWATLIENRLKIAKSFLIEQGSIFLRSDSNGNWISRSLLDETFNRNIKNEIAVKRTRTLKGETGRFHTAWETLFFYTKSDKSLFNGYRKLKPEVDWQWVDMHLPGSRKDESLLYRDFFGDIIKAPEGRRWTLSQNALDDAISKGLVKMDTQSGMPKFLTKWDTLGSNWTDISGYSPTHNFTTENSEELLQRVIESTTQKSDLVFDYFLGSGTTSATAQKLRRKWLGVEMGEHFNTVLLPRMKSVLAYEKTGISKELSEYDGGGFFKYYELEQYEDVLQRAHYEDSTLFNDPNQDPYNSYVFLRDLKMLESLEIDQANKQVHFHPERLYPDIDLAETLSHLTGKWIKRITAEFVEFEDGEQISLVDPDWQTLKPMIWWQ